MVDNDSPLNLPQSRDQHPGLPVRETRTVRSEEILQGQIEVLIAHGDDTYRLRLTRSGKLILQK